MRRREGHVVLVDADQKARLPHCGGQLHRVASAAQGAIAHDGSLGKIELLKHFVEHDRFMPVFGGQCSRGHIRASHEYP